MERESVRVVVVDDDPDTADALTSLLTLDGYLVWSAHSGAEALAVIEREQPHCVLLDLAMPEMAGADLARHVRAQHRSELVLVAITGSTDEKILREAQRAGVDHVLPKPLDPARLRRILPAMEW